MEGRWKSVSTGRAKPAAAQSQVIYCPLHTNSWLTSCRFARSVTFSEKYLTPRRVYAIHFISRAPLAHSLVLYLLFINLRCEPRYRAGTSRLFSHLLFSLTRYTRAGLFILLMMALLFLFFLEGMCFSYRNRGEWKIPVCRDLLSIHAPRSPGLHPLSVCACRYTLRAIYREWKMRPFIVCFLQRHELFKACAPDKLAI